MAKPPVIASDGWVSLELDDDIRVHLHVGDRNGEVVVNGLYIEADQITTDTLRSVHPGRILASVRRRGSDDQPTSAQTETGSWALTDEHKRSADFATRLAAFSSPGDSDTSLGVLRRRAQGRRIVGRPRAPLGRPGPDPALLDDFYRRAAEAYSSAAETSGRPAAVLAEENEVPVGTVHRWVREARRRGHLAPGRRGVAG